MRKFLKYVLWFILALVLILVAVIVIRTMRMETKTEEAAKAAPSFTVPRHSLERFAGGIRIPTVSNADYEATNFEPFDRFMEYLTEVYPRIYDAMDYSTVNRYGMVFRWRGARAELDPVLFLSHYDVVPVVGYTEDTYWGDEVVFRPDDPAKPQFDQIQTQWSYPPFSGAVADGRIYGRGTLDMKCMLFSVLEAADSLIGDGFIPERDIWFAFGHDEEVGGRQGALKIAEHFRQQGMRFDAVYDEGGIIAGGGIPGVEAPMALVGLGEKGFLTVHIAVRGIGGHSSMPPAKGSLVLAAELIQKFNDNQMPARLIPPIESFLGEASGHMNFFSRIAIANRWLFKPMLIKNLSKGAASNALIRTTTAVTMARGSDAANVMSSVSEITVNFRILPGETVADVMRHIEKVCDGYDVDVEVENSREPSAISPEDSEGYRIIEYAVPQIFPGADVASYITIGGTDSYKYQGVSDNIYRFMPLHLNSFEQGTIHNENESILISNFGAMIEYFRLLMTGYGIE